MRIVMAISLLETIKNGDQETAKKILIQKQCSNLDKQSGRKDGTALFWSCCQGFLDVVKLLLLQGADVNSSTAWGAAPVHASVDKNRVEILALLIKFGANVNKQTGNGDTPCHLAAYRGYGSCVQLLAERGANVLIRNNKRKTPLQEAQSCGHYEITRYLQAVENLSQATSLDSQSVSMPYMTVEAVNPSSVPVYPPAGIDPISCHRSHNPHGALYQPEQGFYTPQCISSQTTSQSTYGLHQTIATSQKTSSIYDKSENSLFSSYGRSGPSYSQSSFSSDLTSSSMNSLSYDLNIESVSCDKRDLVGILRLRSIDSVDSEQDSGMNNLSSVDTSTVTAPPSTKPTLTFRNI